MNKPFLKMTKIDICELLKTSKDCSRSQLVWIEKKGTLARVLAPKRAVYHVLTSQGGSLLCFANQEGTLAHVLAPRRALYRMFWLPGGHFTACFGS